MGKLDELRRLGAANVAESTGARPGLPPGLDPKAAVGPPARLQGLAKLPGAARIPVDRIDRDPDQPREDFDEEALRRLADSLRTRGQLQPIRVRWDEGRGVYVILMGERRWRAARMAGLTELSCVIHEGTLEPAEKLALQVVENALREDLKPVEQAKAYKALMEARGWSTRALAAELSVGQASVLRALALLELPAAVQAQVEQGALAPSAAAELARLEPELRQEAAQAVVEGGLRRDEVSELVSAIRARRPAPATRPAPLTVEVEPGVTVTIKWKKPGGPDATQALRRALKIVQSRTAQDGDAA
jgi:ParB family chromosome partitioning protein